VKPTKDAPPDRIAAYETARQAQSSQRIPAEHTIAAIKRWRTLQRFTGRRDALPDTIRAITSLASRPRRQPLNPPPPTSIDPQVVRPGAAPP
jgi:hypothetical protein